MNDWKLYTFEGKDRDGHRLYTERFIAGSRQQAWVEMGRRIGNISPAASACALISAEDLQVQIRTDRYDYKTSTHNYGEWQEVPR